MINDNNLHSLIDNSNYFFYRPGDNVLTVIMKRCLGIIETIFDRETY